MKSTIRLVVASASLLLFTQMASAHPGHDGGHGFAAGVGHPLSGIDHILVMVAVGLWAAQIGGRAIWLLPLTFVSLMIGGGLLAAGGVHVPMVEQGIMASVLVLGLLIAAAAKLPLPAVLTLVGLFAVFHGFAHVAEMNAGQSPAAYAAGFVLATAALHAAGIAIGITLKRLGTASSSRLVGGAIAACGVLLILRVI